MTVATTTGFEFNVGQICLLASRKANILHVSQSLSEADAGAARDELQLMIASSQAKGMFAKVMTFELVPLTATALGYMLAATTMDVVGPGMYVPLGQPTSGGTGETPVTQMLQGDWQALSTKLAQGRPTRYYAHRVAPQIEIRLDRVPAAADVGASIRLPVQRFRADVRNAANATLDYEQFWTDYLVHELGARLASNNGMERLSSKLKKDADDLLVEAKAFAMPRGDQQMRVRHSTGWSNR